MTNSTVKDSAKFWCRRARLRSLLACSASAGACFFLAQGTAFAQDATQAANSGIQEIVVTAQKREQNIQDVPIAVTALSGEALVTNRVLNVADLTGLAPGLYSRANAGGLGSPNISMRGVSASASAPSQDREVSLYLDGVYLGGNRGSIFDLPDIQRIEVLRGPQGTLFGRNSTAGAISIVTRDPSGEFKVTQQFTYGNYDQFKSRTTIDTPTFGPFSAYVTYVHDQRRGDVRNLGAGTTFDRTNPFLNLGGVTKSPEWVDGGKNENSVFAALKFAPSSDFSMVYKFDFAYQTNTPAVRTVTAINPLSGAGFLLNLLLATQPAGGGTFGPTGINPSDRRPDSFNNGWSQEGYSRTIGHNLTAQWRATDDLTVKNIFAYRRATVYAPAAIVGLNGLQITPATSFLGPVGSNYAVYEGNNYGISHQVSDELQINYNKNWLNLTVGALYFNSFEQDGLPFTNFNIGFQTIPLSGLIPLGNIQESTSTTDSYAAYVQAEFKLTPKLSLVAGGRVTKDKKFGALTTGGVFTGTPTNGTISGTSAFPFTFEKTKPTYSIGLNYKASDDLFFYGKFSTGYVSGGAVGVLAFAPETVNSLEGGIKSEWLDKRLRVNATGWYAKYQHLQAAQSGSVFGHPELSIVIADNGPLEAYGMELEVVAAPAAGLSLSGNLSYTHAKLLSPNPFFTVVSLQNYQLVGVPTWTGNVSAQYVSKPIAGDAKLLFRLDANYTGMYRILADANVGVPSAPTYIAAFAPYQFVPGTWLVNGRIALQNIKVGGTDAEVGVWARNLFNNRNPLFPFPFGNILITDSYQPARTFGADLIVKF